MEKSGVRIAYILLVHKSPMQVNTFLQQLLKDKDSEVYIHIDKNGLARFKNRIQPHPRVHVLQTSIACSWGDISLVDATLLLMKEVAASGRGVDFVCLRSGQDLVVRDGYAQFLAQNRNMNFLTFNRIDRKSIYTAWIRLRWPRCTRRLYDGVHPYRLLRSMFKKLYGMGINLRPNRNGLPGHMNFYGGDQWFCFSMSLVRYILDYLDTNPWYREAFENSLVPDTCFFQTLVMNSPFAWQVVNGNHVYTRWGKALKGINHPTTLTMEDIADIEKSGCYFARKFDGNTDRTVIDYFYSKSYYSGQLVNTYK